MQQEERYDFMILKNGIILDSDFTFSQGTLSFNNKIQPAPAVGDDELDCSDAYILPGLIDIHTHGALGFEANDKKVDYPAWQQFLLKHGVTTFIPTTVTDTKENILYVLDKLKDAVAINMEGPYISDKKPGAHALEKICELDLDFLNSVKERVIMTTVAPEVGCNLSKISDVVKMGIRVSVGHSMADYETAAKAYEAGATQVTHTFNCCPPLEHREPGLIGAAFDTKDIFCEVISDGVHVHPSIVRMLYHLLGADRVVLISDAISPTGLSDGEYTLAGLHVFVVNAEARLADGRLAGSTVTLTEAVRRAVRFGIPLEDAVKMASLTPARAIGKEATLGSLEAGKDADVLVLNKDFSVRYVFYKGKQII